MRSRVAKNLEWLFSPKAPVVSSMAAFARTAAAKDKHELPAGFSGHDYAVYLLHIGAEIEHLLMVQYLYAAYSLGGPQVPRARQADVRRWQEVILGIAKEEMAHLITVENVLRLIGGPLNLDRNDYPWDAPFYPFEFALEPLSRASLARYVVTESPEKWPKDVTADEKKEIYDLALAGQSMPVKRVGVLYSLMIDVIGNEKLLSDAVFQPDTLPYQASWDEWGRAYRQGERGATLSPESKTPDLLIMTAYSRDSAVTALEAVAEQGEAADIDPDIDELSHFRRFLQIYREFPKEGDGWSPTIELAPNPRTQGGEGDIPGTSYIANDRTRRWAELFNLRYRMLLVYLSHAFRISGADSRQEDAAARGMIVHRTFGEMYNLRAIGRILVKLPLGPSPDGPRAGPPFEMPYSITLPAAERDCWRLHLDLLDASITLNGRIATHADATEKDYLKGLAVLDRETIAAIRTILGIGGAALGPSAMRGAI
ncbi:ferritin-like protein [Bradyrhizobium diazoefficiens]|nr:ferritin-like protein [Bradyrhizobium diazoefficiens]MBR0773986.1 ferritin-like protein [Bradyrhizobium diazoefficiens]